MDEALINNWNSKISSKDYVYVDGDFCLSRPEYAVECLKRMNGTKFLIEGNHDKGCLKDQAFRNEWEWIKPFAEIKVQDGDDSQRITLCHFALRVWNKSHHGAWHLYGHSHGTMPDIPSSLSFDVGVDPNNYMPLSFEEVKERMSKKTWAPIDHHKAD